MHREPEVLVARVPVEEWFDCFARITSTELAHQTILWKMASSSLFYKSKSGCRFGEKCSYAQRQVDEQPSKRSKKKGDKSAVAMLKSTRQLGCASQDMEPPKSSSILRKSSNMRKPIRCVQFTSRCTSRWHSRHESIARNDLPRWPSSAYPQCSKFWGSVSGTDGMGRAMCPWSSVEAGYKHPKTKGERLENMLLTFGK